MLAAQPLGARCCECRSCCEVVAGAASGCSATIGLGRWLGFWQPSPVAASSGLPASWMACGPLISPHRRLWQARVRLPCWQSQNKFSSGARRATRSLKPRFHADPAPCQALPRPLASYVSRSTPRFPLPPPRACQPLHHAPVPQERRGDREASAPLGFPPLYQPGSRAAAAAPSMGRAHWAGSKTS